LNLLFDKDKILKTKIFFQKSLKIYRHKKSQINFGTQIVRKFVELFLYLILLLLLFILNEKTLLDLFQYSCQYKKYKNHNKYELQ